MFLTRVFGRTLFAAAKSEASAAAAASSSTARRNPLEEFFKADRNPKDEKPVVFGATRSFHCFPSPATSLSRRPWDRPDPLPKLTVTHIDASVDANGAGAIYWVSRDSKGERIGTGSEYFEGDGRRNTVAFEVKGIIHFTAKRRPGKHIICSDSKEGLTTIDNVRDRRKRGIFEKADDESQEMYELAVVVCNQMESNYPNAVLKYVPAKYNRLAHHGANYARVYRQEREVECTPPILGEVR